MKILTGSNNQWLVVELRACRSVLGITQNQLAELSGMGIDSIKRLERKGAEPKYSTINKLRHIFLHLGIKCHIDDNGTTRIKMRNSLVTAINEGRLKEYVNERAESYDADAMPEVFE
ncbi:MAG: helix-turn-helix domain-containing protein [Burkholderiales bacterium]|nr:helix-turn-helix domain-containing protein [Burkholderiales bacterium]